MATEPITIVGTVKQYAWGDPAFIPQLLGEQPDGQPWAELWLGTHPNGPSITADGDPLTTLTGNLAYLLKVLAAAEPLSLQVHPTTDQAIDGFARGVYPDDRAKPELLVALTTFDALCGIRPIDATLDLLDRIGADDLATTLRAGGIDLTIEDIYRGRFATTSTIAACARSERSEARLVVEFDSHHPGDPSSIVTLLLNRVTLQPGEALHLTAGNLHAYLHGAGIELMGASDNVVRGGLTVKHVDVDEFLRILDPTPLAEPVMSTTDGRYRLPEAGCTLVRLEPGATHRSSAHELSISLDGTARYLPPGATIEATSTTFVVVTD